MDEKFSLKDHLFNPDKVKKLASEIHSVYPSFKKEEFIEDVLKQFPQLELKERITHISKSLYTHLPKDYLQALAIILKALPEKNDPTKTDNDFGDFIYAPYAEFVAVYGNSKKYLDKSLDALREITMRFSAEDAIRYFINSHPKESMDTLHRWSIDTNYHVRRLASEGTRPKLPWSQKINIHPKDPITILGNLFCDSTRYVTRSVANHINDISKIDPELAINTVKSWKKTQKQNPDEMKYIIRHGLRTLVKQGNPNAMKLFDYDPESKITVNNFIILNKDLKFGDSLEFSLEILSHAKAQFIIFYVIHFQNKKGEMKSKKTFLLKKLNLAENENIKITKRHKLPEVMTTRRLYPGQHKLEIIINGKTYLEKYFYLEPVTKE